MDDQRDIMSASQVAEMFGVSLVTVRRWTSRGDIPHTKLPGGRAVRYDADRVRRWFKDGCRRPQTHRPRRRTGGRP